MTIGEVAFAVMRKHFGVFLANEPGTRLGEDIEALHDMRVAARRLRAAIQTFEPYLPAVFERLRAELGWVAKALGVVRDLDVQLERMDEWRKESPSEQEHALDGVEKLLHQRRDRGRVLMLRALDSRRYDRFVARFTAALRRGPSRRFAPGRPLVLSEAPGILEKRYKRVRKLGDGITPKSEPHEYHLLRIECKKLRYALEFLGPVYGKPATDFASRLTDLQDLLGLHQDAEVATTMLHDMATTGAGRRLGPETILAMGAIAERYRIHAEELRDGFPKLYRGIKGAEWNSLRKHIDSMAPAPAD
jgi:CHAD domain-containing protein